jgi:hypothetical protein
VAKAVPQVMKAEAGQPAFRSKVAHLLPQTRRHKETRVKL